jgi:L-ribulose-5-phosphate 3-epimerase UlaE
MPVTGQNEIAVMFWAGKNPAETLGELTAMGIQRGQVGLPGDFDIAEAGAWKQALTNANFHVYTVFAAYTGESYADIPTVRRTVGFVPQNTREVRERRTEEASRFAQAIGVGSIATHIGCIPEDRNDADYLNIVELVRRICDYAGRFGQKFALETGQEPAAALKLFLDDVNRPNLGINFDPANMILYGTGDPIEALGILGPRVASVHCKDGDWPPEGDPDALGEEKALGEGSVDFPAFLRKLQEIGYTGPLAIEREASDSERRLQDIRSGIQLLRELQLSSA